MSRLVVVLVRGWRRGRRRTAFGTIISRSVFGRQNFCRAVFDARRLRTCVHRVRRRLCVQPWREWHALSTHIHEPAHDDPGCRVRDAAGLAPTCKGLAGSAGVQKGSCFCCAMKGF